MNATNPTGRFSNRVRDYVKYRPSYPGAVVEFLRGAGALLDGAVVADIGSGTGLLTQLFLEAGHRVFGVEPNTKMREAGEEFLRDKNGFVSIDGTAEATTLPAESVDLATAGQAFHWFDRVRARAEFQRILRPGGMAAIIWNERLVSTSPFLAAFEELLHKYSPDYVSVDHRNVKSEDLASFFDGGKMRSGLFGNEQVFDFAGLRGRLLSSSYTPAAGQPGHEPMLAELQEIFHRHERGGKVIFAYETKVFVGRV